MTVLQRDTATGLGQRGKQVMIGLAMVVVGLAAAYGISQLITDSGGTAHEVLAERSALMDAQVEALTENAQAQAKALEEAAVMQQRVEQGQIQERLLEQSAATRAESQVDVIRRNLWPAAGALTGATSEWTLEEELDAIGRKQQPAPTAPTHQPFGPQ